MSADIELAARHAWEALDRCYIESDGYRSFVEGFATARATPSPAPIQQDGIALIAAERLRQIQKEGWSAEHDDEHDDGGLAMAAALYAAGEPLFRVRLNRQGSVTWKDPWPWHDQVEGARGGWIKVSAWDKRKAHPRLRQLAIAGALIAAEIDRLQRIPPATPTVKASQS